MGFEVGLQEHGANLARNAIGDWPDEEWHWCVFDI
jgi:hypothetical protein